MWKDRSLKRKIPEFLFVALFTFILAGGKWSPIAVESPYGFPFLLAILLWLPPLFTRRFNFSLLAITAISCLWFLVVSSASLSGDLLSGTFYFLAVCGAIYSGSVLKVRFVSWTVFIAGVAEALFILKDYFTHSWGSPYVEYSGLFTGFLSTPEAAGIFLFISSAAGLHLLREVKGEWKKYIWSLLYILLPSFVLTGTWYVFATLAVMGVIHILSDKSFMHHDLKYAAVGILVFLAFSFLHPEPAFRQSPVKLLNALRSGVPVGAKECSFARREALELFIKRPGVGYGWASYPHVAPIVQKSPVLHFSPCSLPLKIMVEGGGGALAIFFVLTGTVAFYALRHRKLLFHFLLLLFAAGYLSVTTAGESMPVLITFFMIQGVFFEQGDGIRQTCRLARVVRIASIVAILMLILMGSAEGFRKMARQSLDRRDFKNAISQIRKAHLFFPWSRETRFLACSIEDAAGAVKNFVSCGAHLVDDYPGDYSAHFLSGISLVKAGDKEGAEREFRESVKLAPYFMQGYVMLVSVLRELGDLDGALKIMRKGDLIFRYVSPIKSRWYTYSPLYYWYFGDILMIKGNFKEAKVMYEKVLYDVKNIENTPGLENEVEYNLKKVKNTVLRRLIEIDKLSRSRK